MENLQKIRNLLTDECKMLAEKLSQINSAEDFILNLETAHQLSDTISQLVLVDELNEVFTVENLGLNIENEFVTSDKFEDAKPNENAVIYSFEDEEKSEGIQNSEGGNVVLNEENFDEKPSESESEILRNQQDFNQEIEIPHSENTIEEQPESIISENLEPGIQPEIIEENTQNQEVIEKEKKFKLANIKGISSVQSLFHEDDFQQNEEKEKGSLQKSNMPTEYMEAEKQKPEFRLDLNDKIAFSKHLFDGSQVELNDTIDRLNKFKTLDEAKEFLSDIYYEKNWDKAEDYAQRLWALVENKFL